MQSAYDCGYGTNAVCDRISFKQMFTKSLFKIYDLTNHSTNESICPLFSYTAVLVGVWLLFDFFLKWTASRIAKPMADMGLLQIILVCSFFL